MAKVYDCADRHALLPGMREARAALGRGELVVLPTDTVYGIGADAFDPVAVERLLDAKGRGRDAPPPVLVPTIATMSALAEIVPPEVERLAERFWPGALTIVLPARATLSWDLGDTGGTVALRMPDHDIALELLTETGPLAVSSANRTGLPAATTVAAAQEMLGDSVAVYLDAGPTRNDLPSTIIDASGFAAGEGPIRVLRVGALPVADLEAAEPAAFAEPEPEPEPGAAQDGRDEAQSEETDGRTDRSEQAEPTP